MQHASSGMRSIAQPQSHEFVDKLLGNLEGKEREGALNMIRDLHMLETEVPRTKEGTILRTQMSRDFDLKEVSFISVVVQLRLRGVHSYLVI